MITFSIRRDLGLQLLRLGGTVRLREIHALIEDVAIKDPDPPFGMVMLIDTRDATRFDTGFVEILGLNNRINAVYSAAGHRYIGHILVGEAWKSGMVNMFNAAAGMLGNVTYHFAPDEASLLAPFGLEHLGLAQLFGPETFYYSNGMPWRAGRLPRGIVSGGADSPLQHFRKDQD